MASWSFTELPNVSNACRLIVTVNRTSLIYDDCKSEVYSFPKSSIYWSMSLSAKFSEGENAYNFEKSKLTLHIEPDAKATKSFEFVIMSRLYLKPEFEFVSSELKISCNTRKIDWSTELFCLYKLWDSADNFGDIKIYFNVTVKRSFEFTKIEDTLSESCLNLYAFLMNEQYSDVTLKAEGKEFKVHKLMLASHSSVFDKMFKNGIPGVPITLENAKAELIEEMLHYVYTNEVTNNISNVSHELCKVAYAYEIKGLQNVCINDMLSNISTRNFIDVMGIAEKYSLPELKQGAVEFITMNEEHLVKYPEFINYLTERLNSSNVAKNLIMAYKYNLAGFKSSLMKFIANNFKEVIKNKEYRELYSNSGNIILEINEHLSNNLQL